MKNLHKVLETERFVLNKMELSDINEIFLLRSLPEVMKYLGRDPLTTLDQAKKYILRNTSMIEKGEGVDWAIRYKGKPELIGKIGFFELQPSKNRAEVGYSLLPEHHRQGVISECMQRVLDYGFQEIKWHTICAEIDPFNTGSKAVLEKAKFRKEAHFTEDYFYKGIYTDSAIYSLLERWR